MVVTIAVEVNVRDKCEDDQFKVWGAGDNVELCRVQRVKVHGTTDTETMCFMRSRALYE